MATQDVKTSKEGLLGAGRRGEVCAEFWRRAGGGTPFFQRCDRCGYVRYPPAVSCPACGCIGGIWISAAAPVLAAWTITHAAAADRLPSKLRTQTPYALGLVRFPGIEDFLLPVRLEVDDFDELVVDLSVELVTDPAARTIVGRAARA